MNVHLLTINQKDYALILHSTGAYDAAEQRHIEMLEELHEVKHFKGQFSKRDAANWAAGQIGCAQKKFQMRILANGWQAAVDAGPTPKRTHDHPWRLAPSCDKQKELTQ